MEGEHESVSSLPPPRMPPSAPGSEIPLGNPARRRRRTGWIVAGLIALGLAVIGVLALGTDELLTHDLLSVDFSDDDSAFFTGEDSDFRAELRDGRYRLTAITSSVPVPLETFGFFARTAYNVDIEARVAALEADDAVVGLECAHAAGGGGAGARYVFTASTSGAGYQLAFAAGSLVDSEMLAIEDGPELRAGQRIGLRCNDGSITGLIDDTAVISSVDPAFDSFKAAALVFGTANRGDWVEFDDFTAVVPEH